LPGTTPATEQQPPASNNTIGGIEDWEDILPTLGTSADLNSLLEIEPDQPSPAPEDIFDPVEAYTNILGDNDDSSPQTQNHESISPRDDRSRDRDRSSGRE